MSDRQTLDREPTIARGRQLRDFVIVYVLATVVAFAVAFGVAVLRWVFDWGQPRPEWTLGGCVTFAAMVAVVVPAALCLLALGGAAVLRLRRRLRTP